MLILSILLSTLTIVSAQDEVQLRLGGLFERAFNQEDAFKYAIEQLVLNRTASEGFEITYQTFEAYTDDSFRVTKSACSLIGQGIAAMFGPYSSLPAQHVQSICSTMDIPHIEARPSYTENQNFYSMNLWPHYTAIGQAVADIVNKFKWKHFSILYQRSDGFMKFESVFQNKERHMISVRQMSRTQNTASGGEDYLPLLKEVMKHGERRIIVDCDAMDVYDFLNDALSLSMLSSSYHYVFTTFDMSTLSGVLDFKDAGANITSLRLIDPDNPQVRIIQSQLKQRQNFMRNGLTPDQLMRTEVALMYDAVNVFASAIRSVMNKREPKHIMQVPLSCEAVTETWAAGPDYMNALRSVRINGLSGHINFDEPSGYRTNITLGLIDLSPSRGFYQVGTWSSEDEPRIKMYQSWEDQRLERLRSVRGKTINVTTIIEEPFVMLKEGEDAELLQGNDMYEGFLIDILDQITKQLKVNYSIHIVKDGLYGAPVTDDIQGEWNGMVGELVRGEADIALAPLTISYMREQVIDFTKPYLNLGISILYKKPVPDEPSLDSFLQPLHIGVWVYILGSYIGVSVVLYIIARFSPYEWVNPHPCNPDSDVLENQFDLLNSLWFTIGSLMQQGCEIAPRAVSTRLISGLWWFFTLIMISSYTANLAAFLTVERMNTPIKNADDLSMQTDIHYGSQASGSTMNFFKNSKIPTYARMWNFMQNVKPTVFVNSSQAGINRVKTSKYAYLMESVMIEYQTQRNCSLMQIGGLLDTKGYGIGTQRGSVLRDAISDQILRLSEAQEITIFKNKWWKEKRGGGKCSGTDDSKKNANALGIEQVAGVFVLLLGGMFISIFVALCEFIYNAKKNPIPGQKKSICEQIASELRFAVQCGGESERPKLTAEKPTDVDDVPLVEPSFKKRTPTANDSHFTPIDNRAPLVLINSRGGPPDAPPPNYFNIKKPGMGQPSRFAEREYHA